MKNYVFVKNTKFLDRYKHRPRHENTSICFEFGLFPLTFIINNNINHDFIYLNILRNSIDLICINYIDIFNHLVILKITSGWYARKVNHQNKPPSENSSTCLNTLCKNDAQYYVKYIKTSTRNYLTVFITYNKEFTF